MIDPASTKGLVKLEFSRKISRMKKLILFPALLLACFMGQAQAPNFFTKADAFFAKNISAGKRALPACGGRYTLKRIGLAHAVEAC